MITGDASTEYVSLLEYRVAVDHFMLNPASVIVRDSAVKSRFSRQSQQISVDYTLLKKALSFAKVLANSL